MLTQEEKKEIFRKRGEGLHQWVMRICPYFRNMEENERSTVLYNIVAEAYKTGVKESRSGTVMQRTKLPPLMPKKKGQKAKVTVTEDSSIIEKMSLPITNTGLGNRVLNILKSASIRTVGDLVQYSSRELRNLPKAGVACICEIEEMLEEYGLNLSGTKIYNS